MKNKGFTLIELLVVIAIMGLLAGVALPNIIKASKNLKIKLYCSKIETLEAAAVLYGEDHQSMVFPNVMKIEYLAPQYVKYDDKTNKKIIDPRDETQYLNDVSVTISRDSYNNRIIANIDTDGVCD